MIKKAKIVSVIIAAGMIASSAHATSEVIFSGAVSATTCDLVPAVGGNNLPNQVITLSTVAPNQTGEAVEFALIPVDKTSAGCKNLAGKTASIDWSGIGLAAEGFRANPGSIASDATVLLTAKNSKTPNTVINAGASTVDFEASSLSNGGLKFDAKTKGGAQAGNFQSTASFSVAYK